MVRPHAWRSSASALTLAVCGASLAVGLGAPGRALASGRFTSPPAATSSSLTIAGGVEPIARLLDLDPEGPRSLFLVQVIRRIHDAPWGARENAADLLPGLLKYLDSPDRLRSAVADQVPLLLPPDVWSSLVLRRAPPSSDLLTAILRDRKASLLYHGLYALDDETLGFLASRDETLRRIYSRSAPAFATLARSIRIENGELIVPGGPELRPAWESLVGESCATPERFLTALLERDEGRLAFLFDTLANVSHAQLRFATRSASPDPLGALYQTFRKADPGWKIERRPFARTAFDAATLLMSIEVTPDGELIGPRSRSLWQAVFADGGDDSSSEERRLRDVPLQDDVDAAWLAAQIGLAEPLDRQQRLESLWFGQRVFDQAAASELPSVLVSLRGLRRYPMLVRTLDRIGIRDSRLYATAIDVVSRLRSIDEPSRARAQIAALQSSLALIERLKFRHALDDQSALALVEALFDWPEDEMERHGRFARWLEERLLPRLAGRSTEVDAPGESALLHALAGLPLETRGIAEAALMSIEWEGARYRVAPREWTLNRLSEVREHQDALELDAALAFVHESQSIAADADPVGALRRGLTRLAELAGAGTPPRPSGTREDGVPSSADEFARLVSRMERQHPLDRDAAQELSLALLDLADRLLAESLTGFVYASPLATADGVTPEARDLARRHDLGVTGSTRADEQTAWQLPVEVAGSGAAWHFVGSLLGLDVVMAPLSLRRIFAEPPQRAPRLNENDRATFVQSLALLNPFDLTDAQRDMIATGLKNGRARAGGPPGELNLERVAPARGRVDACSRAGAPAGDLVAPRAAGARHDGGSGVAGRLGHVRDSRGRELSHASPRRRRVGELQRSASHRSTRGDGPGFEPPGRGGSGGSTAPGGACAGAPGSCRAKSR